jgi:hypothetical protein
VLGNYRVIWPVLSLVIAGVILSAVLWRDRDDTGNISFEYEDRDASSFTLVVHNRTSRSTYVSDVTMFGDNGRPAMTMTNPVTAVGPNSEKSFVMNFSRPKKALHLQIIVPPWTPEEESNANRKCANLPSIVKRFLMAKYSKRAKERWTYDLSVVAPVEKIGGEDHYRVARVPVKLL